MNAEFTLGKKIIILYQQRNEQDVLLHLHFSLFVPMLYVCPHTYA